MQRQVNAFAFALALCFLGAAACKKAKVEEPTPPEPPRQGPVNEPVQRKTPVDPNAPMHLAKTDEARIQLDLAGARAAIREYQQLNGEKNPPDLETLHLRLSFPADLIYDPGAGTVKSRSYPAY